MKRPPDDSDDKPQTDAANTDEPVLRSTVDPNDPNLDANRKSMGEMILQIGRGKRKLDQDTFADWEYDPRTALEIISAASIRNESIYLSGRIAGSLSIAGGGVHGDLIVGFVDGDFHLKDHLFGGLHITEGVSGHLIVARGVSGSMAVRRSVSKDLIVAGGVEGNLYLHADVSGQLVVVDKVDGDLEVSGHIAGPVSIDSSVSGNLVVSGTVQSIRITGEIARRTILSPKEPLMSLSSVRGARFGDEVFIGDNVDISACDFRQCPDLDRFSFVGAHLFERNPDGLANPPAASDQEVPPLEMASIYRQMRTNLESRQNRSAAGIFYRGEMDSRRRAAKDSRQWAEWLVLSAYRIMSGYGLRAWAAAAWFGALAAVTTWWFTRDGLDLDTTAGVDPASISEGVLFSVRSMVAFFSPPDAQLSQPDQWIQLGLRFLGPVLIAQAVLAVREHVAR